MIAMSVNKLIAKRQTIIQLLPQPIGVGRRTRNYRLNLAKKEYVINPQGFSKKSLYHAGWKLHTFSRSYKHSSICKVHHIFLHS